MRQSLIIILLAFCGALYGSPEDTGFFAPPVLDGSVTLTGETSGSWRWVDVNDQPYSTSYQASYSYTSANVTITYTTSGYDLIGHLSATGLKPHFAYQLKLLGFAGTTSNELIGYRGRWWQERWDSTLDQWVGGVNLNSKGTGASPNPNDLVYDNNKVITDSDPENPTGYYYKHTAYRVFDYFITDASGSADFDFVVNNSYHVLWKTTQSYSRTPGQDGRIISHTFDVDPATETAYDVDYTNATVDIFAEWERLPLDNIELLAGDYNCQFVLTEESFHGLGGALSGQWALAMKGDVAFTIWAGATEPDIAVSATSTAFPTTGVGCTSNLTFSVTNNGTADLLLLGLTPITFIGADASHFSVASTPTSNISSGVTSSFAVAYRPTSIGTHTVTMRIVSNDPDTSDYDIILTGTAVPDTSDDDDWDDKLKDDVKCGLQPDGSQPLLYYLMLLALMLTCKAFSRRSYTA